MSNFTSLGLGGLLLSFFLAGCQQEAGKDGETPPPGRDVAASALCDELATLVCESDKRCCTAEVITPPSGTDDAGTSDDAASGDAARDTAPAPVTCESAQLTLCRSTLGRLLDDPRLSYRPERGGKFIDELRTRSEKCWSKPIVYADIAGLFAGSAAPSSDCTPASTGANDLRAVSLSCTEEAACRLYLRSDGTSEGVCEKRSDQDQDSCSHAFDCGATRWCKLPKDWKPGLWGRCQPLRASGWQCASDLECESGFCGDGVCNARDESNICLAIGYRKLVLVDKPVTYLRLSDVNTSIARDESPEGHPGAIVGELNTVDGALAKDFDKALEISDDISGPDNFVKVEIGSALVKGIEYSIEGWIAASDPGPVFELRGSARTSVRVYRGGDKGDEVRAAFLNPADGKLVETAPTTVDGAWHHIVVTHDGSTGRLFVDGKEVGSVAAPFALDASDVLYVGHRPEIDAAPAQTLKGKYDEIAVYPSALEAGRILRRHKAAEVGTITNTFPVFSLLK